MNRKRPARQQSEEVKAKRAEKRAEREAAAEQSAAALAARRSSQLKDARGAVGTLEETLRETKRRRGRRMDLADHVGGFYDEVDKLAKGKSMLEVTERTLEEANQIIRDAKAIAPSDTYLDRMKEFVAAGNNPVYPDVVVALRTIRQALDRADSRLENLQEQVEERLREARIIEVALVLIVDEAESPTLSELKLRMEGDHANLDLTWFTQDHYGRGSDYSVFDVHRLDELTSMDAYFAIEEEE